MGMLLAVFQVARLKLVLDAPAAAAILRWVYGLDVYFSLLQAFCLTLFQAYRISRGVKMVCLECHAVFKPVGS